jgi:hypothetical protein
MPHRSFHSAVDSQPDQDTAAVTVVWSWAQAERQRHWDMCAERQRHWDMCGSVVSWGWSLSWFIHATVPASSLLIRLDYFLKVLTLQ